MIMRMNKHGHAYWLRIMFMDRKARQPWKNTGACITMRPSKWFTQGCVEIHSGDGCRCRKRRVYLRILTFSGNTFLRVELWWAMNWREMGWVESNVRRSLESPRCFVCFLISIVTFPDLVPDLPRSRPRAQWVALGGSRLVALGSHWVVRGSAATGGSQPIQRYQSCIHIIDIFDPCVWSIWPIIWLIESCMHVMHIIQCQIRFA